MIWEEVSCFFHLSTGCKSVNLEFQESFHKIASATITKLGLEESVKSVNSDAGKAELSDGDIFYFFDPFRGSTLRTVMEKLFELSQKKPVTIICAGFCEQVDYLESHFINSNTQGMSMKVFTSATERE